MFIDELPINEQLPLKSIRYCGSKVVPRKALPDAVYLMKSGSKAKFVGQTMCKNPFACPCCSAYMMAKYASEIANALDALKSEYFPFMITFTTPHLRFMSCRMVTDILFDTFKYWRHQAKQIYLTKPNKKLPVVYHFYNQLQITHWVAVLEYTWGVNGWHPHFHAILWAKRSEKDNILKWQNELAEWWAYHNKRIMRKHFAKRFNNDEFIDKYVNNLFNKSENHEGCYISRHSDGTISECLSSDYIAGWGADKELTGNYRKQASHDGHLTPYQILEKAYYGDEQMKQLYLEFCKQVRIKPVHHRVIWSQTGLKKIAKDYKQHEKYLELVKKKETAEKWTVVLWFSKEQWSEICYLDSKFPFKSNILYLTSINAIDVLKDYLHFYGISASKDEKYCPLVESLFNRAA